MRGPVFFLLMAAASAISLLKLGLVAAVLPTAGFAAYSAAFGASGFVASAISLGLVEATGKRYARWSARGWFHEMSKDMSSTLSRLALRSVAIAAAGVLGFYLLHGPSSAVAALAGVGIGLSMNIYSVAASALRGLDRLVLLGIVSVARVVAATAALIAAAALAGWQAGLATEALVSLTGAFAVTFFVGRHLARRRSGRDEAADDGTARDKGGYWLFGAFMIAGVPLSLDRLAVATFDSTDTSAQYAFLAIWITGAYTVSSIYIQKFGPDIIRYREAEPDGSLLPRALAHGGLLCLLIAAAAAATFVLLSIVFRELYWDKYELSATVAAVTVAAAALQVAPLFDWTLIALDKERWVLWTSTLFVAVCAAGFAIAYALDASTSGYMSAMAAGRLAQLATQSLAIAARQSRSD